MGSTGTNPVSLRVLLLPLLSHSSSSEFPTWDEGFGGSLVRLSAPESGCVLCTSVVSLFASCNTDSLGVAFDFLDDALCLEPVVPDSLGPKYGHKDGRQAMVTLMLDSRIFHRPEME